MDEREATAAIADDELVLGRRDSEWTGIAPVLEEDVAFSWIAQNEIGHARALYELIAEEVGGTADQLAFDRSPHEYRHSRLVELRLVPDWARTLARHVLYEAADAERLEALKGSDDPEVAGLAAKIDQGRPTTVSMRRCGSTAWPASRASPRLSTSFGLCWTNAASRVRSSARCGRR